MVSERNVGCAVDLAAAKERLIGISRDHLIASGLLTADVDEMRAKALIYVNAISLTDNTIGELTHIQADLVNDIERQNLLPYHPARYDSIIDMLNVVLRNNPRPGRALQLAYVRDQVLPLARSVVEEMDGLPPSSNLEEIAPQAREAINRGNTARVGELVQMASTLSLRDLRDELRPQEVAAFIQERLGPNQVRVSAVLSNKQVRLLNTLGWITWIAKA
jgi:hypothetical protein